MGYFCGSPRHEFGYFWAFIATVNFCKVKLVVPTTLLGHQYTISKVCLMAWCLKSVNISFFQQSVGARIRDDSLLFQG